MLQKNHELSLETRKTQGVDCEVPLAMYEKNRGGGTPALRVVGRSRPGGGGGGPLDGSKEKRCGGGRWKWRGRLSLGPRKKSFMGT